MATVTTPAPVRPVPVKAPIGPWGFVGFALTSFGGPLALAGLIGPAVVEDAGANAGIVTLAAVVVFGAPLAIWLDYSRRVHGSGGLYDFVRAAAGQRVALVQAAIWTVSYVLYVVYTTVQIVYQILPAVLPGERQYQTALALVIPALLAIVVIAGTRTWLIAAGVIGGGQLLIALLLGGVTIGHLSPLVSGVSAHEPVDRLLKPIGAGAQYYICGSLPLFLGGELTHPTVTIRRGLLAAFGATAIVVLLAVAPLAASPDLLGAPIAGVSVAERFVGSGLAHVVGVGIAVSTAGVILAEYVALTRLARAIAGWRPRPVSVVIGVLLMIGAAISLTDPDGFYDDLVRPSLVALWLSQLIVFLVYPRYARRHGRSLPVAWTLAVIAVALAGYGVYTTIANPSS